MRWLYAVVVLLGGVLGLLVFAPELKDELPQDIETARDDNTGSAVTSGLKEPFDKEKYSLTNESSLWLVVNKERPVSLIYKPRDLVNVNVRKVDNKPASELLLRSDAARALERMFEKASDDGIELMLGSGHRDSETQKFYYENYIETYGLEAATRFSAEPGTSEHQIGLAADVSPIDGSCYLQECFADTKEGQWVANNAHNYGFIVRYPKGKEDVTGYQYEPWHLRFVGEALSKEIYESESQTLEEFFNL